MVVTPPNECPECGAVCLVKQDKGKWILECPHCNDLNIEEE